MYFNRCVARSVAFEVSEVNTEPKEATVSYSVIRFYADLRERRIVRSGLTLKEAQTHCQDRETSSRTTTTDDEPGTWFDGYEEE